MILAIDVGGTKMAAGLVADDGTVTMSTRAATPQGADASTLWKTLMNLVDLVEPLPTGLDGVGVGGGLILNGRLVNGRDGQRRAHRPRGRRAGRRPPVRLRRPRLPRGRGPGARPDRLGPVPRVDARLHPF
ncbi:hypothetical protein GCM10020216_054870 [Nonomuraea helvata]